MWDLGDIATVQKVNGKRNQQYTLAQPGTTITFRTQNELVVLWDSSSPLLISSSHITWTVDKLFPWVFNQILFTLHCYIYCLRHQKFERVSVSVLPTREQNSPWWIMLNACASLFKQCLVLNWQSYHEETCLLQFRAKYLISPLRLHINLKVWNEMTSARSDQSAVRSSHHNTSPHNSAGFGSLLRRELGLHVQEHWIISPLWRWRVRKDPFRSGLRTHEEVSSEAAKFYFSMLGTQHFSRLRQWRSRG